MKLLENASHRIVRDENDLLDVLFEELQIIGSEAGRHIEMLYLPDEIANGSKRRHESALQSYIECRLADRLPGRILDSGTQVSIHRERQVQFRERTDIEVTAPILRGGKATIVIEVKWSDNNDSERNTSTALMDQLGDRYLLGDNKTHGIYFVGWNGRLCSWRKRGGNRPKPANANSLTNAFRRQAKEYKERYSAIRIEPVVIDLEWPSS